MTLLADLAAHLDKEQVAYAVVGAAALSAHGIARATADVDLMTTNGRVLRREFWQAIPLSAASWFDYRFFPLNPP